MIRRIKVNNKLQTIRLSGIVRHYHTPNSDHLSYKGLLKTHDDENFDEVLSLSGLLCGFPDGEEVEIIIIGKGKHPNSKGFQWMLTKPHLYERVKKK